MTATSDLPVVLPSPQDLADLTEQVWSSFIGGELTVAGLLEGSSASELNSGNKVISSVSINGPWCGHLTIAVSHEAAQKIASEMFMIAVEDVESGETADAMGELANVVGGNVKSVLPEPSVLTLPQVVIDAQTVTMYSAQLCGTAVLTWGEYAVEVSLWESAPRRGDAK